MQFLETPASSVIDGLDSYNSPTLLSNHNVARSRSKIADPSRWKQNIRKRLRNTGLTYLDKNGQIKRQRLMKPGCHRQSLVLAFGGGAMASAVARAYNGGLGAVPPAGSRGRAPGQGVWGAKPPRS